MRSSIMASVMVLAAGAALASDTRVKDVDVEFDLTAVENAEAAQFWADLEKDLETAIITLVADRLAETGSEISIDIDEFSMSNSFEAALGSDSVLAGGVAIRNEADSTKNGFFDFKVTVAEAGRLENDGTRVSLLSVPVDEAYTALVNAYAAGVVERMR